LESCFVLQSTSPITAPPQGLHVAVIMDGNGRWATARARPRSAGHAAGVAALRRAVEAAPGLGVGTLTVYAFSSDNWSRPSSEVSALLRLMRRGIGAEVDRCVANGVRLSIIGRRDRLPPGLRHAIEAGEQATAGGRRLWLRVAIDYSARDAILRAASTWHGARTPTRDEFSALIAAHDHSAPAGDVDLLIRTGGDQRLSDFLLWECAYAELYFTPRLWPEFDASEMARAVADFHRRERRFGGLPAAAAG
jgi:undecaprenyl diphosphate synthase